MSYNLENWIEAIKHLYSPVYSENYFLGNKNFAIFVCIQLKYPASLHPHLLANQIDCFSLCPLNHNSWLHLVS